MQLCKGKNAVPANEILSGNDFIKLEKQKHLLKGELCIPSQGTE